MANTPKKMKDPTEAALSAIQDALHVRDDDTAAETQGAASGGLIHPDEPASDTPWQRNCPVGRLCCCRSPAA